MVVNSMKNSQMIRYMIIVIILSLFINCSSAYQLFIPDDSTRNIQNPIDEKRDNVFFVIGIGMYFPRQGTWPVIHVIDPIYLLKISLYQCEILIFGCSEQIDFVEGDKLFGFYPFFQGDFLSLPLAIGFVCGIWIDK